MKLPGGRFHCLKQLRYSHTRKGQAMRLTTITRALAALPATREELAERLGVKEGQANAIARELLCTHQAEEWGSRLTSKGTLAPVLQAKEASNVA